MKSLNMYKKDILHQIKSFIVAGFFFVMLFSLLGGTSFAAELGAMKQQAIEAFLRGDVQLSDREKKRIMNSPQFKKMFQEFGKDSITKEDVKAEKFNDIPLPSKVPVAKGSPPESPDTSVVEETGNLKRLPKSIKSDDVLSLFERYEMEGKYQDISTKLKPFGYNFFEKDSESMLNSLSFVDQIESISKVPDDYMIKEGDEILVNYWGRINDFYSIVVDEEGVAIIPQIGQVKASGMPLKGFKEMITSHAKKMVGTKVNVKMGSLRDIQVFVLGEVIVPGSYTLNSYTTVINALLKAKGPSKIGSLRKILLKRKGKVVKTIDLYSLFLYGNLKQEVMLQSGDVIFVPTVGPLVGIAGNVKRPGIYELTYRKNLKTLFDYAGGITPSANTQQIQIRRIVRNEQQIIVDIKDQELRKTKQIKLQDGDLVKIFSIVDKNMNAVYLNGNVKRPGKYEFKKGMGVRDIITSVEDLQDETYFDYSIVKRLRAPEYKIELVPFSLRKLFLENNEEDPYSIRLMARDKIYVFSRWFFEEKPTVSIDGEVRSPGNYPLEGMMTIKDLVLNAQGVKDSTYFKKAELYRTDDKTSEITLFTFNLKSALEGRPADNLLLKDRDRIVIHAVEEFIPLYKVELSGEVNSPGEYAYIENMTVKDLIFAGGSFLESAYLESAEMTSYETHEGQEVKVQYKTVNINKALQGDPAHNLILKPHDRLFVRQMPNWAGRKLAASLLGEFKFPGEYLFQKGEKLSSLIERAGGYSKDAYLRGVVFIRSNLIQKQQEGMDQMIQKLEMQLFSTSREMKDDTAMEQKKAFISSLKQMKATGRMTVWLTDVDKLKGTNYDIELEDGDIISLPTSSNVVSITGSVMSPGTHIYEPRKSAKHYVALSGGYTESANPDFAYVLKVDGTAHRLNVSRSFFASNEKFPRRSKSPWGERIQKIEPGDTIVVPEELEHIDWMAEVKDITTILMNIAVTAGTAVNFWR